MKKKRRINIEDNIEEDNIYSNYTENNSGNDLMNSSLNNQDNRNNFNYHNSHNNQNNNNNFNNNMNNNNFNNNNDNMNNENTNNNDKNNNTNNESNQDYANDNVSHYEYKEKEYPSGSLEKNTVVTKASAISRFFLIGFYLILIVVGISAFFMIRANKYEFYLKSDAIMLSSGSTYQIELVPKNEKYFDYLNYDYSIADETIATVDEFGTITAVGTGTTTLKISLRPGLFGNKTVRIISEDIDVNAVKMAVYKDEKYVTANAVNLSVNQSTTTKAVVNNRNDINANATFVSSNTDVAVVDMYGNITGKSAGQAVITGTVNGVEGTIVVNVKETKTPTVINPTTDPNPIDEPTPRTNPPTSSSSTPGTNPPTSGSSTPRTNPPTSGSSTPRTNPPTSGSSTTKVNKVSLGVASQLTKNVGDQLQLSAAVEPSTVTNYTVTWKSSNTSVATVSNNGLIKMVSAGTVDITAEVNGVKGKVTIVVKAKTTTTSTTTSATPPAGTQFTGTNKNYISIDKTQLTINKGSKSTFKINLKGAAGMVKVTSSDSSIAKVILPTNDDVGICNTSTNDCFLDGMTRADEIEIEVSGLKAGKTYINVKIEDIPVDEGNLSGTAKVGILVK